MQIVVLDVAEYDENRLAKGFSEKKRGPGRRKEEKGPRKEEGGRRKGQNTASGELLSRSC